MTINIRVKGASAERDIANKLNEIISKVLKEFGVTDTIKDNHTWFCQRNQNQSAVGGSDLTNTYGYCIEVKRQETLNINSWWKQVTLAATKNGEIPVLIYRQTRKQWKCVIQGYIALPNGQFGACKAEVDFDTFLKAFESHVRHKLKG